MKRMAVFPAILLGFALLVPASPLLAADIVGTVRNATTGRPAADVSVSLLALQRQMATIADAVTDAQGRYRITVEAQSGERFLVQASYGGVNYNAPVVLFSTGETSVDVTVYDSGARLEDLHITEHAIFLFPAEGFLAVTELYLVNNETDPPRAFAPRNEGFRFGVPDQAANLQVSVSTPSGAALRQQSQESSRRGQRTLGYEFRPGQTRVQVEYQIPLDGENVSLTMPIALPVDGHFAVIPAVGVEFTSTGLSELPQNRSPDRRIFQITHTPGDQLALALRIDAEALASMAGAAPAASAGSQPRDNPVKLIPQPVNRRQFYIVGLGLFVLAMGFYYLTLIEDSRTAS